MSNKNYVLAGASYFQGMTLLRREGANAFLNDVGFCRPISKK